MRALILGIGDAFTARYFGSSALIEAPGGYVLLDCPDLIHRALRAATTAAGWSVDTADIDDVIITHLHGDHCNGLESFGFSRLFLRRRDPSSPLPRLYTNEPSLSRLWERLAPGMDGAATTSPPRKLENFFHAHPLDPDAAATIAGLSVRCRFTKHPIPTTALLISDGSATLGWSSDTPHDAGLIDWLSAADVIVHESNVGPAHTAIEALNGLPDDLRTKIRLIHLPDAFDPSVTDIRMLREGEGVEVGKRRSDGAT